MSGWVNPPESIDDPLPPEDEDFELVETNEIPNDSNGIEFMIETRPPEKWWQRRLRLHTKVMLWTRKSQRWHLVARFVSPYAAMEYAALIGQRLLKAKNAQKKLLD